MGGTSDTTMVTTQAPGMTREIVYTYCIEVYILGHAVSQLWLKTQGHSVPL